MNFEEFLQKVSPKLGPNGAFNAFKDVKINALKRVLIEKGIFSQEEIETIEKEETKTLAQRIEQMPPPPVPKQ